VKRLIIGGGLTGLVAAERLAASGLSAPVLEKEAEPGGACRTIEDGGFCFDHTGHLLHVGRKETQRYFEELGLWNELAVWERSAAIVVGEAVTPYPIQVHTHGLAPEVFPYNRKLYRAEPEELGLDWVGRYVPKPDLEEVVDGALGLHRDRVGYNAVFRYPKTGGIRILPDRVAEGVADLRTGTEVTRVHLGEGWVECADGARLPFDTVVSTISLPALVDMIADALPDDAARARQALRWVRVLNIALGVRGPAPVPEHWRYFPDPELPYYRVGFPSNHGCVAPEGCHTVSVEISLDPGGGEVDGLVRSAEAALAAAGLVDPEAVLVRRLTMVDPAYVVFDHPRRHAVAALRSWLGAHGVRLSGRWAEWKYSAMEDAVLDGIAAARRLVRESG